MPCHAQRRLASGAAALCIAASSHNTIAQHTDRSDDGDGRTPPTLTDQEQAIVDKIARDLRQVLIANRIDPAVDDLQTISRKNEAIRRATAQYSSIISGALFDTTAFILDYSTYVASTAPQLSGQVVRIGPDHHLKDFASALPTLQQGDLVILDKGAYELAPEGSKPTIPPDIAIVGQGPEKTTLRTGQLMLTSRLMLSGLTIDCNSAPFIHQNGGGLHLRNCVVTGYNDSSNHSYAISGATVNLLVEDCLFEGKSGRSSTDESEGEVFGARGSITLFARRTQFVDNRVITDARGFIVLDACVSMTTAPHYALLRRAYVRDSRLRAPSSRLTPFTHAFDDIELVRFLVDPDALPVDETTRRYAQALALKRRLPYWIPLIRHQHPEVRSVALEQVESMTGIRHEALIASPTRIPDTSLNPPLKNELIYASYMKWYEQHAASLVWDHQEERFRTPD